MATFRPPLAGTITVEVPGVPSLAAGVTSAVSREDIDFSLDEGELARLAQAGGGRYVPLHEVARAAAELPSRPDRHVTVREIRLWALWWLLPGLSLRGDQAVASPLVAGITGRLRIRRSWRRRTRLSAAPHCRDT